MIKNILNTFLTKVIASVISFLLLVFTTQYLGASGRGIISIITASVGIITLFNGFIGGASLVYIMPRNKNKGFLKQVLGVSYLWAILVSVVTSFILHTTGTVSQNMFFHILILGAIASWFTTNGMLLLSCEKIFIYNFLTLMQITINFFAFGFIIFVLKKITVASFIFSLYISYIIALFFAGLLIGSLWKSFGEGETQNFTSSVKEIIKYGFILQLGNVFQYLNYRLSYYVLNYYSGSSDVGIYSVGVLLSESVWIIAGSIALVQYSRIANTKDIKYSRELTLKLSKISVLATFFALIAIILMPSGLFITIFGKEFGPVRQIMLYLSPGILIFGLTVIISHYFAGIGKYYIRTTASFVGLLFTVVFNFLLVPKYGYIGAAITGSLSYLSTASFLIFKFLRETGYSVVDLLLHKQDVKFIIDILNNVRHSRKI